MRLTIERLRTLVLAAGILLIAVLVVFLALGKWRSRFNVRELPKRLGADIKQEANGVTYTQSRQGHTLFKIHASKEIQLRQSGRVILHDVQIEIYGPDGKTQDRIAGGEFEYDQKAGTATAAGPVEIMIARLTAPPPVPMGKNPQDKAIATALQNMEHAAGPGQIDVKTSGLTFDQKTGVAMTQKQVEFTTLQGSGSAVGAMFDSEAGTLQLSHNVDLNVHRGAEKVQLRAQSAGFDRGDLVCQMRGAEANYREGSAAAGEARILFRPDGSAVRLDARSGFTLTTATGSKVASPTGWIAFNQKNQPQHGQMLGGVTMESVGDGRTMRGTAPAADLAFTAAGELKHARLERGVEMHSEQRDAQGATIVRDWRSPVADLDFRKMGTGGQVVLTSVHGMGGAVITSETRRGAVMESPSRMSADDVSAQFGSRQELTHVIGAGHASLEETTAAGARETTSGDRVDAQFATEKSHQAKASAQIQSATVDGHVVLTDEPANKGPHPQPPLRATAAHAVYDGANQWLHLTGAPRVEDGGLEVTANRVDVSQASGDAFARGSVKGTWQGDYQNHAGITLGGDGPAHVVAAEAQVNRAAGEATFRGQARLWQRANSIAAPVIVLNQNRQTLVARGGAGQPVNLVLLSAGAAGQAKGKPAAAVRPEVVRVRAGDLKYSEAERKAVLRDSVVAETATATISSNQAEVLLLPPGNHAAPDGGAAQVDRIMATGHVLVSSQGRRGTGERLVYTGETGNYVLTGTAAEPPALSDPVRGTIRGTALIFNGRNDSVSIEGSPTSTETVAPR